MAARAIVELWRGQNFSGSVPQTLYKFQGFDTSLDVDTAFHAALDDTIPLSYGGLPVDIPGRTIADLGGKVWHVMVPYSAKAGAIINPGAGAATQKASEHGGANGADEPVPFNIAYAVNGATEHITQSIETLQREATNRPSNGNARTARLFGRAIGVTLNNGKVEVGGVDVYAGDVSFSVKVQIPNRSFNGAYAGVMEDLLRHPRYKRACVNAAPFYGYAAGEVLIRSASVGELGGDGYRLGQFDFSVSRNQEIIEISDDPLLELYDVKGWSHIWVTYEPLTETVGADQRITMLPFEAYEERIYPEGDFSALNLEYYRVAAP